MKHVMADENENVVKIHNRNDFDIHELASLFLKVLKEDESLRSFCIHPLTLKALTEINDQKTFLASFKTTALWIQYLDMVNLLHTFIKVERTGNWNLHLQCIQKCFLILNLQVTIFMPKSAYVYLQTIKQLHIDHPNIRASFQDWAGLSSGLSSDFVIEQVSMRSVKTRGGLTRGRGMAEAQRSQ